MKIIDKFIKVIFWVSICITAFFIITYIYAKITPKFDIKGTNNIVIYDSNNNIIFNGNGNKEWIGLKDISQYLIDATIYTEDKRFFTHNGFDFKRIIKSMYLNITNGYYVQGASTITQQYAKNLFLDFDKNLGRKIEEAWLAFELEMHYTKEQILEGYLNTINYGNGVLGIENASLYYFGKSASKLNLAEASMLAGIPKSPNNYSPLNDELEAKKRQKIILNNMMKNNIISKKEMDNALNTELVYIGKKDKLNLSTLMYYKDAVISELEELNYIDISKNNNLKIYTSLDLNAQTILEENMNKYMKDNLDLQISSIMMKPNTGEIIALIGGRSYISSEYNRATKSKRQIGSTMKPFLYYAALENGFTATTTFLSEPTTFTFSDNSTYAPQNYSEIYPNKNITMALALAYSDNIYAVKTHLFLGEDVLVDIAKRVGINEKLEPIPSLPLGTIEINIIDLIRGYSTLANEGNKITPHTIQRIEDSSGNILYKNNNDSENVLNKSITFILNELLTSSYDMNLVDYSYPTCLSIAPKITNKYAIKTGTTDTDVWIVGYNKDIILAMWNGYDNNKTTDLEINKISKNIWVDSIEAYFKDKKANWYDIPNNVIGVLVDPINGNLVNNKSIKKKILYFIKGTEPTS